MKKITIESKEYKKRALDINAELLTLPEGRLVIRGARYSHVVDEKEIGITKDIELIGQLSRKKYLLAHKKLLDENISIISEANSRLANITHEEIIRTLPASYLALPDAYFHHPSVKKHSAKPSREISYKGRKYETKKGTVVRTRAEYLIATQLEDYDINYHYESAFTVGGKTKYPDFIIINPYTGKLIIWEHFGSLHIPEYEASMNEKMELYLTNGFIPFETIIYTFEFDMNTKRLKSLIENIILD